LGEKAGADMEDSFPQPSDPREGDAVNP
jgi:hypothetical protein